MPNYEHRARVTTKVYFDPDGEPKGIDAEVYSYEQDMDFDPEKDDEDDEYRDGASADIHFSHEDGVATIDGVKDASSDAYGSRIRSDWEFGPQIVRAFTAASRAVERLPFIDEVEDVEEMVARELEAGRKAKFTR
jgi:hypothetical protein